MKRALFALWWVVAIGVAAPVAQCAPTLRPLPRTVLEDKVRGGWAGQMVGVAFAAKHEFVSNGAVLEGQLPWSPQMVANALSQDDLYVEMTFAQVMDQYGIDASAEHYAAAFAASQYKLWHANARARLLLQNGVAPPWSGHPRYNPHANDIDFQIEADFIGLMSPGLPHTTNRLADRIGHLVGYGDGVYGGMFVAAMYAAAFFESNPRTVVETALRSLPADSRYARTVADVLAIHAQHPDNWRTGWQQVTQRWDVDDADDEGSLLPFNIDAHLNGAYVVLALLYGQADMQRTLEIATRAGQDADCNASTAAGVLGVIRGYAALPAQWTSGIPALAGQRFDYTDYTFESIVASTLARAEQVVIAAGGSATAQVLHVPLQTPIAAALEQWDAGVPEQAIAFDSPAWQWRGPWTATTKARSTATAGASARLQFNGVGVMLVGKLVPAGGRADVFIDGQHVGMLDAYIPERTFDRALWWHHGLAPGQHELQLVLRADAHPRSTGRELNLERAVIYRAR